MTGAKLKTHKTRGLSVLPRARLCLWVLVGLCLSVLAGCSGDLSSKSFLQRLRIVGVEASVVGSASRSNPLPGESVEMTVRVAEPEQKSLYQWHFIACLPDESSFGVPRCVNDGILVCPDCIGSTASPEDPSFQISIPDADALSDHESFVLLGALCAGEPISFNQVLNVVSGESEVVNPCANAAGEGEFLVTEVPIQRDGQSNLSPVIEDIFLGGLTWESSAPLDAPTNGCEGLAIQQVQERRTFPITIGVRTEVPETYVDEEGVSQTETLQVSWTSSTDGLDRPFSFIEGTNQVEFAAWDIPTLVGNESLLVRFFFVVRDGRGGTVSTERALCVVP